MNTPSIRNETGGFGERTFSVRDRTIVCNPKPVKKADGRTNISLGFPFATLTDATGDDIAEPLAEYLSCPKRAAAPELYEALADLERAIAFERSGSEGDLEGWMDAVDGVEAVRERARALLAKARGETA